MSEPDPAPLTERQAGELYRRIQTHRLVTAELKRVLPLMTGKQLFETWRELERRRKLAYGRAEEKPLELPDWMQKKPKQITLFET